MSLDSAATATPSDPTGMDADALAAGRLRAIRFWLVVVIVGLVLSGVTAFPLREELAVGRGVLESTGGARSFPGISFWIDRVAEGVNASYGSYPFLAYGTDWLAFAHLVIAVAFIGPLMNPVRNVWVIVWGLIMCVAIVPLAVIAGGLRGIPIGWQLIDMSFGVVAAIPLTIALVLTRRLERGGGAAGAASADSRRTAG